MASGRIAACEEAVRMEARRRQALAAERLAGLEMRANPDSFHVWLTLPDPWRPTEFARAAEARGVTVTPAESFAIGRDPAPFAARLSLTGARTHEDLARGLDVIAELARLPPEPYRATV
jgi:DNA-binding transcriptional MocR family regulator